MNYNQIKSVANKTTIEITSLDRLDLMDNKIEIVRNISFVSLDYLTYLEMGGNQIRSFEDTSSWAFNA